MPNSSSVNDDNEKKKLAVCIFRGTFLRSTNADVANLSFSEADLPIGTCTVYLIKYVLYLVTITLRETCRPGQVSAENNNLHLCFRRTANFQADSPPRPAAPQSCPPQTRAAQKAPRAGLQRSPSSAESFPTDNYRNTQKFTNLFKYIWRYKSEHANISNTHIFQFNVSPLVILEWE